MAVWQIFETVHFFLYSVIIRAQFTFVKYYLSLNSLIELIHTLCQVINSNSNIFYSFNSYLREKGQKCVQVGIEPSFNFYLCLLFMCTNLVNSTEENKNAVSWEAYSGFKFKL